MSKLFEPAQAGSIKLKNRITMAALTRSRAGSDGVPTELHREYYSQRASAGLVVTEGTFFDDVNRAFLGQPGITTDEQVAGWKKVADAVHQAGGTIVMQIMHGGRMTLPSINNGEQAQAPSAIAPDASLHGANGREEVPTPRALETSELPGIVQGFADAARRAVLEAGVDGVEVHSANGYLLHEFLSPSSNKRTDEYGGSPENRARMTIETVRAVAEAIGSERTALRISPQHNVQGVIENDMDDVKATYGALFEGIADLDLAYLSVLHADIDGELVAHLRTTFGGFTILNSGFGHYTELPEAQKIVDQNLADAVAVGRQMIANPDLVRRWNEGLELNTPNEATFYVPGAEGYTDYPFA
ncbi:alkene reductase [Rothia aerolata]|uniref:Alkene reductase n=1 Tax=Rothia aerolata TaxID=1812262 RepID=A0A917IWX2_9MICC|nr:alkene reductase [Rothia aerolata]GGH64042.1 alkene reductase [Rothia aerolata]